MRCVAITLVLLLWPLAAPGQPHQAVVTSANRLASDVGVEILDAGGNAMDAAVAVQMALTLVDAPETGIGGGGFLLYRDAQSGEIRVYDGREVAPLAAQPDRFKILGLPMPKGMAIISGRSVGVPGMVAMLHKAHRAHGRLSWRRVLAPAIRMAEDGVAMPPRLAEELKTGPGLWLYGAPRSLLKTENGMLRNPALAKTLRQVSKDPRAFYTGAIAEEIVAAAGDRWPYPSDMTRQDLAGYEPEVRAPVCGRYRIWRLCGAPPPSSGGIAVLQILGMLERFALSEMPVLSAEAVHLIAEASRLAFADRNAYVGDPAFVDVPVAALLDEDYLAERSALIRADRAMKTAPAGIIAGARRGVPTASGDAHGTSHLSILDAEGNAVAFTGSIEAPFGSRIAAAGFLLNNQLTDFDFKPERSGMRVPNAVAPGKRPRSSMAPTLVFEPSGKLRMIIGSRGGKRIIGYTVKAIIAHLDWDLSLQEAAELPNFVHAGETLELEKATSAALLGQPLKRLGHEVRLRKLRSGLHGITVIDGDMAASADPRTAGAVAVTRSETMMQPIMDPRP